MYKKQKLNQLREELELRRSLRIVLEKLGKDRGGVNKLVIPESRISSGI
ncbi:hypothetical protein [Leptospira weilii]|nr:hypothetical protein [Leptospira weilii]